MPHWTGEELLSAAAGDRVDLRTELLLGLLASEDWEARYDALGAAKALIEGWRGPHAELVEQVGARLDGPARAAARAARTLEHPGELAAPAAGAFGRSLERAPRQVGHRELDQSHPPWVVTWGGDHPTFGPTVWPLLNVDPPRVLPVVEWAIERPDPPRDVGNAIAVLGSRAAGLLPRVARCCASSRPATPGDPAWWPPSEGWAPWRRSGRSWSTSRAGGRWRPSACSAPARSRPSRR